MICCILGSYEEWRDDADDFPEAVRGDDLDGWEGEQWLDIRSAALQPIMQARLDLAVTKGCDGVEPDNMDGYTNESGFDLEESDQITYNRWMATEAQTRDLSVGLKNAGAIVEELVGDFDFSVVEQCFEYEECDQYSPFVDAGKAVFGVEYKGSMSDFCDQAKELNFSWIRKRLSLKAFPFGHCPTSSYDGTAYFVTGWFGLKFTWTMIWIFLGLCAAIIGFVTFMIRSRWRK